MKAAIPCTKIPIAKGLTASKPSHPLHSFWISSILAIRTKIFCFETCRLDYLLTTYYTMQCIVKENNRTILLTCHMPCHSTCQYLPETGSYCVCGEHNSQNDRSIWKINIAGRCRRIQLRHLQKLLAYSIIGKLFW